MPSRYMSVGSWSLKDTMTGYCTPLSGQEVVLLSANISDCPVKTFVIVEFASGGYQPAMKA